MERESTFVAYKLFWEEKDGAGNQPARVSFDRALNGVTQVRDDQTPNWNKTRSHSKW